jgi:hypothetical protein
MTFMYSNTSVDFGYTKHCLQLALLGHKYEVPPATSSCRSYLESYLPNGVGSRDFWIAQQYHEDRSIIPLAIRASKLLNIPTIAPWAMYMLVIKSEKNDEWLMQSEEDRLLMKTLTNQIRAVRILNRQIVKNWNRLVTRFMNKECHAEWWGDEDGCWRRTELMDLNDSGFMLHENVRDPLQDMYEAMEFCCEGLCSLCADAWTECASALMENFLDKIEDSL